MNTTPDVAAVLRAAKERISDPARWCQGRYARSAKGRDVLPTSPRAIQWCAEGAMLAEQKSYSKGSVACAWFLLNDVALEMGGDIGSVNDTTGHATVMDLFDRAVALAEKATG